jgi:hypothetical protein
MLVLPQNTETGVQQAGDLHRLLPRNSRKILGNLGNVG